MFPCRQNRNVPCKMAVKGDSRNGDKDEREGDKKSRASGKSNKKGDHDKRDE